MFLTCADFLTAACGKATRTRGPDAQDNSKVPRAKRAPRVRKLVFHNHVEGIEGFRVSSPRQETWMVDRIRHGDRALHRLRPWMPSTRHGTSIKKLSQFVGHFSRKRRRQETAAALPKLLLLSRLAASSKRVAVSSEMVIAGSKRAWTISRPYPAASLCAMGQKPTRTCQGLDSHGAQQRSMSSKPCDVVAVGNGGNGGFGNIPACWKAS